MLMRPGPSSDLSAGGDRMQDAPAPAGILDPRGLRLLLRRRVRLIGAIFAATLLAGIAVVLLVPSRYTATAVLLVDPRQQRVVQSETVLSGIGNDSAAVESQVEVIQSTSLARTVIDELHLEHDPDYAPSVLGNLLGQIRSVLGAAPLDPQRAEQRLVARFEDNLRVLRRGQTYVLEIGYLSRDPERAATVANAVAKAYLAQQIALKRDATAEASGWLDSRLDALRAQANAAERAVADYKASHNIVDTGERGGERQTIIEQQLADINAQLVQARVKTSDVQSRYDQVKQASPDSVANSGLPEALQSPVILALRTQYAQTARNVAQMAEIYGPRHPAIRTGRAELDELRRQLAGELGRISAGLHNELEAARSREHSLETSLKSLKSQSASTDQDTVRLRELQREADATRTVLAQFLLRYKETSEQQSLQTPDARILSPASAPLRRSSPNVPLVLGLAVLAGLGLGIGSAVAADRFSRSVRTVREVEDLLALPVLALLPAVGAADLAGRGRHLDGTGRKRLDRFGLDHPLSRFGEAIRGLVIRLRAYGGNGCSVLLVTSAVPGEGSSTIAGNIASVMARNGSATLLIDTDLRRRAGASSIGGPAPGLFEALRDGTPPLSLARRDPSSGLLRLSAGRLGDAGQGSELLTGRNMSRVLETLRSKFDTIVLDGTSILPSVDSRALLELADAALLVVAWDDTSRDSLEAAVESAGLHADKFRGIVLNKVNLDLYRTHDDLPQASPDAAAA